MIRNTVRLGRHPDKGKYLSVQCAVPVFILITTDRVPAFGYSLEANGCARHIRRDGNIFKSTELVGVDIIVGMICELVVMDKNHQPAFDTFDTVDNDNQLYGLTG